MKMSTESSSAQDFKEYLKRKGYSNKSIISYQAQVNRYLKWVKKERIEPEQITNRDILLYMKYCGLKGNSQRTIQSKLVSIDHYYSYLKQSGRVDKNPTSGIEIKGVKRSSLYHILEAHELSSLYQRYPIKSLSDARNKVITGMLVYQGLKTEEVGKLSVSDVKMREGLIDVPGSRRNNSRTMKLEPHQVLDLYDYLQRVRPEIIKNLSETERLFINLGGSDNYTLMMRSVISTIKQLNPTVKSINQIRTSVITKWLKMYNLREVQYRSGHKHISSTESYIENEMEGLVEEINQYHPLN